MGGPDRRQGRLARCPPAERRVGIGYSLWHTSDQWRKPPRSWGTPAIGFYRSDDPRVLATHAAMLTGAGVDFVVVDWSNDLGMDVRRPGGPDTQRFIESATLSAFAAWGSLAAAPAIAIMIGMPDHREAVADGRLSAKAEEVHALFVADRARARLTMTYRGKPLLLVYAGTPSPWRGALPPWSDPRFETRFVTGYPAQQNMVGSDGIETLDYWSWEDRREPAVVGFDGEAECMTAVAAWRGADSPGRDGGRTYEAQWAAVRRAGPRFALAGTFNEWWASEQIDAEHSKDVEPSKAFGTRTLDLLRRNAEAFKAGA